MFFDWKVLPFLTPKILVVDFKNDLVVDFKNDQIEI